MKAHWKMQEDISHSGDVFQKYTHIPEIIQLFLRRGIQNEDDAERFLSPDYARDLHDPFLFEEMDVVVERFNKAIEKKEKIGVYGDFDADGVTGSALFREALEGLGLDVIVYIPNKEDEGHGISQKGVEYFKEQGATLMCSVDCGVSDIENVDLANSYGIDVIIIDHHHTPENLPKALAVINPKLKQCTYPFKELCGAGTAFKVAQGLYAKLAPKKQDQLKWLLDLAAIGTVADCMPLVGENRVLVKYGLVVLSKTRRAGLQHMFEIGRIRCSGEYPPSAMTIGFQIGPRINAAGRMAHAQVAHDMLVEKNHEKARAFTQELELHNKKRQQISEAFTRKALKEVKETCKDKQFILSAQEEYPLGIVGLIAGRLASELKKPTAILKKETEFSKGSFRSIPGINIISLIEQCSDFLEGYGGHAQAAGITIRHENIQPFYDKLHGLIQEAWNKESKDDKIRIDAQLNPKNITFDLVDALKRFAPFGEANTEPLWLVKNMKIADIRFVGSKNAHLKLRLSYDGDNKKVFYDAIGFHMGEKFFDMKLGDAVEIIGHIQENIWNGKRSIQLQIVDIEKIS